MILRISSLILSGVLLTMTAFAGPTHEYHLKNGLTLIVREDHRAPVVLSSVWYKVGGSYEHDGITGISHMLEHMMFKGTKKYKPGELNKIVSDNGGDQNAMTGEDYTVYYQKWSKDKLPLSLMLEADRMKNLTLQQDLYNKEHQVVMEERRLRVDDNPQAVMVERYNAAAYVNSPYHHPVVGWMTDISHLTLADLSKWYHAWYAPNNAIVIIIGDVSPNKVFALTKKYFSTIKKTQLPSIKPREEVAPLGSRFVYVHAVAKLPWLVVGFNTPSLKTVKKPWEAYALLVASGILDSGTSSRLQKDLVRGKQIAVSASSSYNLYSKYSTDFSLTGVPTEKTSSTSLLNALEQEVVRLQSEPVSKKELERVKAQVIANNVFEKDSLMNQLMNIGAPEAVGLSWKSGDNFVQYVNAVTADQIQQVARRYLTKDRMTVGELVPKEVERGHR